MWDDLGALPIPSFAAGCRARIRVGDHDPPPAQILRLNCASQFFADGIGRSLGLSREDRWDLRQDIALAILLRLRHFDAGRGPFGAFIELVARRAAGRLKARIVRRWMQEFLVNPHLPDPVDYSDEGADDQDGRLTLFFADDRQFAVVEFRHDLRAALERAPGRIIDTFRAFEDGGECPLATRTTWYRRRVELRRWLLAHGLSPPR